MDAQPSLVLSHHSREIFWSYGRWLHPLFDLESFLDESDVKREALSLRDKMVGKAAAVLILRLGIRRVHANTISALGKSVLEMEGVELTHDTVVERILCGTEELLAHVDDVEEAYRILRDRLSTGRSAS